MGKVNKLVSGIKPYEEIYKPKYVRVAGTNETKLVYVKDKDYSKFERIHYFRNKLNKAPSTLEELLAENERLPEEQKWVLLPPEKSAYHMNGSEGEYNLKFVSADGHFEAIYNKEGTLLTEENAPINMGTYNYFGPDNFSGHEEYDVEPYYELGNTKELGGKGGVKENLDAGKNLAKFVTNIEAISDYIKVKSKLDVIKYNIKTIDRFSNGLQGL